MELVVEDRCFAEAIREETRDLGDEITLFSRERKGDAEAAGNGNQQITRDNSNGFMVIAGPARRDVASIESDGIRSVSGLPGGESGVPSSQLYVNLLRRWLTNETFWLRTDVVDVPDDRDDDDEDRDGDRD